MAVIKWRDGYNTGVAQFDMEHHKIVELIDSMYAAIRDKSGKEITETPVAKFSLIPGTILQTKNKQCSRSIIGARGTYR